MGLEEKRKLKEIQDGPLKETLEKIKALVGIEIPIEIDVASFTSVSALEGMQYSGFSSLVQTIEEVAKDDLGKDALKESLKKIVFKNLPSGANTVVFDGGVFTNASTWGGGSYAGYGDMSSALLAKL